jgi:hypothetical protein
VPGVGGRRGGNCGGEVGGLVAGQRDQFRRAGVAGVLEGGGGGQGGGGGRDPPVPGGPAADLVLIQAGQALSGWEVLLDRPAKPGGLDQGGQRDRLRGAAVVEGQFPGARVPADQRTSLTWPGTKCSWNRPTGKPTVPTRH